MRAGHILFGWFWVYKAYADNDATHFFSIDASLRNGSVLDRIKTLWDRGIRDKDLRILAE